MKTTIDDIGGDSEVAPIVVTFLSTTFADYLTLLLLRSDLDTESGLGQCLQRRRIAGRGCGVRSQGTTIG